MQSAASARLNSSSAAATSYTISGVSGSKRRGSQGTVSCHARNAIANMAGTGHYFSVVSQKLRIRNLHRG